MKKLTGIFFLLVVSLATTAQVVFKTILKEGPAVTGESFQVQYVLEHIDGTAEFFPPEFKDFRFISGPYVYEGSVYGTDGLRKMRNFVFTLEPKRPGRFIIPGASAKLGDYFIKSDNVALDVISSTEAARLEKKKGYLEHNPAYFLGPGEDPYDKIRNNLFLKVQVDKKTCFVGEPVTATFKLYSRLASRSDIVKNPGFYGFTVQDMISLNDKVSSIETIDGKKFDVHTVRKVQLYPLRAGTFNIDPMEVMNKVDFSRSMVSKKVDQQIQEGVYADKFPGDANTETYESSMSTKTLAIAVKASPSKTRPQDFSGATGRFVISVTVNKNELRRNEEAVLTVKISGKGNFTQLSAPLIEWPAGLEGFTPHVTDRLDHKQSPLKGERVFQYAFVSARPGSYIIPGVRFSFFDPDSNHYKTVAASGIRVVVNNMENPEQKVIIKPAVPSKKNNAFVIGLLTLVFTGIAAWALWLWRKRRAEAGKVALTIQKPLPELSEILQVAQQAVGQNDKEFYATLRKCIWHFFSIYFGLAGSNMNQQNLQVILEQKEVDEDCRRTLMNILEQCETGLFADAQIKTDKEELLRQTAEILERIKRL